MSEPIPVLRTSEFPRLCRKNSESLKSVSFGDKLFDSKVSEYFSADFAILNCCKPHIVSLPDELQEVSSWHCQMSCERSQSENIGCSVNLAGATVRGS